MFDAEQLEAQQILDELFTEGLIPFKLSARMIDSIGGDEYIVRFHDSRLSSLDISWPKSKSFKDVFRTAMLDRVKGLKGS